MATDGALRVSRFFGERTYLSSKYNYVVAVSELRKESYRVRNPRGGAGGEELQGVVRIRVN